MRNFITSISSIFSKKNSSLKKIRKQFTFFGTVQGVGFRYTATKIATQLGITGFVKNQFDGTVLLEAQGTNNEIAELLKLLLSAPFIEIEHFTETELPLALEEKSFCVR